MAFPAMELLMTLLSAALVNNLVLVQFLGLCPVLGVSKQLETALSMGLATTFVLTLSAVASDALYRYVLAPFEMDYLRIISFILVIAVMVQLTEQIIHKTSPLLHRVLGIFLPLITTNCAVLGVALLNTQQPQGFVHSAVYGLGAALGFTLVLVIFAALRERLSGADVPAPFQGVPIALITAGIMSLAWTGLAGLRIG